MKKKYKKLIICAIIIYIIAVSFFLVQYIKVKNKTYEDFNYTFILDGENMSSIMVCENYWHYEKIDGFIPCVINNTVGGIGGETIDWKLSPQENCNRVGGEFTGLNLYNLTRAKELYDVLLPRCYEFNDTEITNTWLNVSDCVCLDESIDLKSLFVPNCQSYSCGNELIVKKK